MNALKVPKGYKKYHKLKSPTAKAKRKAQFKRCLNQAIINLHEIRNTQVRLVIGDKDVNLNWSLNDLKEMQRNPDHLAANAQNNDGNIPDNRENGSVTGDEDLDADEGNGNSDFPDAFLPDGSWNPGHIRCIIHVLDLFHISHDAYHELRLTSRSILPPVHHVKKEKKSMCQGINYYKSGTVSSSVKGTINHAKLCLCKLFVYLPFI